MRKNPSITQGDAVSSATDSLQLAVETATWLAAWLVFPAWLALQQASASQFLLFAIGSGPLLAFGVALDRGRAFYDLGHFVWFTAVSCLAMSVFGGVVFGVASLFR